MLCTVTSTLSGKIQKWYVHSQQTLQYYQLQVLLDYHSHLTRCSNYPASAIRYSIVFWSGFISLNYLIQYLNYQIISLNPAWLYFRLVMTMIPCYVHRHWLTNSAATRTNDRPQQLQQKTESSHLWALQCICTSIKLTNSGPSAAEFD